MNQQDQPEHRGPTPCRNPAAIPPQPVGSDPRWRTLVWGDLGCRSVLLAHGPDAVRFIDHFTTAAVSALAVGTGTEGFFADARGWVLALANILRVENGVWIDAPSGVAARLHDHLEHYHIREQVELRDESAAFTQLILAGPQAEAWLAERCGEQPPASLLHHTSGLLGAVPVTMVRVDWYGTPGFLIQTEISHRHQLVAWMETQPVPQAAADAWETARIEAGTPAAHDIPEKTLPQELARDQRAISFTKGCYLGQETVARIDALGHVNRRFVAVAFEGRPGPAGDAGSAPDTIVRSGNEVIGRLTSICFSPTLASGLGLGLLQSKAIGADQSLTVGAARARVVAVPLDGMAPGQLLVEPFQERLQPVTEQPAATPMEAGEVLLDTKRFRVVRVAEQCTDGSRRHREVVRHPGSVVIVPLVSPDEVCLVEVVRVAVGRTLLELPAGTLDRVESLEEAARRELAEETGYRAGRITSAGSMWMSPGILRERMHLYVAEDLVAGPQALEPGEQIRTRVVPWNEALAMCLDGRIDDAKSIAGLLLTDARRRQA